MLVLLYAAHELSEKAEEEKWKKVELIEPPACEAGGS